MKSKILKNKYFLFFVSSLVFLAFIFIAIEAIGFRQTLTDNDNTFIYDLPALARHSIAKYDSVCFGLIVTSIVLVGIVVLLNLFIFVISYKYKTEKYIKIFYIASMTFLSIAFIFMIIAISLHLQGMKDLQQQWNSAPSYTGSITYNKGAYVGQYILVIAGFGISTIPALLKK